MVTARATSAVDASVDGDIVGSDNNGVGYYRFQFSEEQMLVIGEYTMRIYLGVGATSLFLTDTFRVIPSPSILSTFVLTSSGLALPRDGTQLPVGKPVSLTVTVRDGRGDLLAEAGLCASFSASATGAPNTVAPNPPLVQEAPGEPGKCLVTTTPQVSGDRITFTVKIDGERLAPFDRLAPQGTVYSANPFVVEATTALAHEGLYFTLSANANTYRAGSAASFTVAQSDLSKGFPADVLSSMSVTLVASDAGAGCAGTLLADVCGVAPNAVEPLVVSQRSISSQGALLLVVPGLAVRRATVYQLRVTLVDAETGLVRHVAGSPALLSIPAAAASAARSLIEEPATGLQNPAGLPVLMPVRARPEPLLSWCKDPIEM